jgi:predicted Fe-S protein YdhL (DUF1289 family)
MMVDKAAIEILAARAITARTAAENVPSPCVSVCRMDAQGAYCEGCLRSLDEIRLWSTASDVDKKAVWVLIAQRIEALPPTTVTTP